MNSYIYECLSVSAEAVCVPDCDSAAGASCPEILPLLPVIAGRIISLWVPTQTDGHSFEWMFVLFAAGWNRIQMCGTLTSALARVHA